jgi:hypothetical protein
MPLAIVTQGQSRQANRSLRDHTTQAVKQTRRLMVWTRLPKPYGTLPKTHRRPPNLTMSKKRSFLTEPI